MPLDGIRIEQEYGHWIQVYRRTGIFAHIVGADGANEHSAVGVVPNDGGDFLPFLKRYRAIIESESKSVRERIVEVRALLDDPTHARFARALQGADVGWVEERLRSHLGISSVAARSLLEQGHLEASSVFALSDQELRKVPKIGPKMLAQIRSRQGKG